MRKKMVKLLKNELITINILFIMLLYLIFPKSSFATTKKVEETQKQLELTSLSIENYEFYPAFNSNITTYYLSIPSTEKSLEINCVANDENAKVKITGNNSLKKQENLVQIALSERGYASKTYKIYATKQKDDGPKLSSLTINEAELNPQFERDKYYYNIEIKYTDSIEPLQISAIPDDETTKVEILGNTKDSLIDGDNNIITILLNNKNGTSVYQINATFQKKSIIMVTSPKENNTTKKIKLKFSEILAKCKNFYYENKIPLLVASTVVALIIIITVIIKSHKRKIKNSRQKIKDRV